MKTRKIPTPIGLLFAIADDKALYRLEFDLEVEEEGTNRITDSIQRELELYFTGRLRSFNTPLQFNGTPFQKKVWGELQKIPYGTTASYSAIAKAIHNPLAVRAVGSANSKNPLSIIVPCHRVINANGNLGGYAGGTERKKWLLAHEQPP